MEQLPVFVALNSKSFLLAQMDDVNIRRYVPLPESSQIAFAGLHSRFSVGFQFQNSIEYLVNLQMKMIPGIKPPCVLPVFVSQYSHNGVSRGSSNGHSWFIVVKSVLQCI